MDDRNFDDETALQWIEAVEGSKISIRDQDIYPAVRAWILNNRVQNVLEIGSGQGICSDKIDLSQTIYTGVEPSPILLKRAKELYGGDNRNFISGNAHALPFSTASFDGCFSILVWHLLGDLLAANKEISRVLRPGGNFLIITANPGATSAWKGLYSTFTLQGKRLEGTMQLTETRKSHDVLYLHEQEELLSSFNEARLVVEKTQTFRPSAKDKTDLLVCIEGRKI